MKKLLLVTVAVLTMNTAKAQAPEPVYTFTLPLSQVTALYKALNEGVLTIPRKDTDPLVNSILKQAREQETAWAKEREVKAKPPITAPSGAQPSDPPKTE